MKLSYLDIHNSTDPAWNLALEQYVFDCLPRDRMYFMLWQNDRAVIIGKYQNTLAEINQEYIGQNGISVVRRLSGGGAVYHDMGNLNFTFITDAGNAEKLNFRLFCEPVVRTLAEFGIRAEITGRNDMVIDGCKFSGNAQYIRSGRMMHHGTILYSSDLQAASDALHVDQDKIRAKGVSSVRSRITNVSEHMPEEIGLEEFRQALLMNILSENPGEEYVLTEDDIRAIDEIRDERYGTWEWNYGRSRECEIIRKQRFEGCGTIEARISLDHGLISDIEFTGDFFSVRGPEYAADMLKGVRLDEESLYSALRGSDIGLAFSGLSREDLMDLLIS